LKYELIQYSSKNSHKKIDFIRHIEATSTNVILFHVIYLSCIVFFADEKLRKGIFRHNTLTIVQ